METQIKCPFRLSKTFENAQSKKTQFPISTIHKQIHLFDMTEVNIWCRLSRDNLL